MYRLYKHTSPKGKVYIGITNQSTQRRWAKGKSYRWNIPFYNDIEKYGWDNFKHEILFDNLTREEAEQKEVEYIFQCKSDNSKYGYNIRGGGKTQGLRVKQLDETGNIINVYPSIKEASNVTGINQNNILRVCKNKRGSAGGYIWRYYYDSFYSTSLINIINEFNSRYGGTEVCHE